MPELSREEWLIAKAADCRLLADAIEHEPARFEMIRMAEGFETRLANILGVDRRARPTC